jgi:hypothetical protein
VLVGRFIRLTWIGARPVREPYIILGQCLSVIYFSRLLLNPFSLWVWDKLLEYPKFCRSRPVDLKWFKFLAYFKLLKLVNRESSAREWANKCRKI